MVSSALELVGNTPMLKIDASQEAKVWLKLENRNPGGSIKDRPARYCIESALARGELAPGATVVAATSGNMGIGLALVSTLKGLKCTIVMPESMSRERRALLQGYGARLVLTPAGGGMGEAVAEAERIAREEDGWLLDQFAHPAMVEAHYKSTGPEIWRDLQGKVDALVSAVGSGSTLTGAGRYLREQNPELYIAAVEPELSPVLSGGKPGAHGIQGIGAGFVPRIYDPSLANEVMLADVDDAMETSRRLMAERGVCAGISTGANLSAALKLAARPDMAGKNIVTFVCDTGERYLSTPLFAA